MSTPSNRWPAGSTPGLARLRASQRAETIRQQTLADQERALADAGAAIAASTAAAMAEKLAESRDSLIEPEPSPAKPVNLSEGAAAFMAALFKAAGDGSWIDQKQIPHGMNGRAAPGYLSGLTKRGLVEARWDGGARFSARLTVAGAALMAESAP